MFVFFASIIKSQSNVENIYAPSAGYYSGGFLNLADDDEIGDYTEASGGRDIKLTTVGPCDYKI